MPPDPPLPPFGTPPPHPQAYQPPRPDNSARTVDRALSWVLFVLQLLGTLVLGLVSIFAIFATDSCGSNTSSSVPAVCDSDYFGGVLIGYWIALFVLVVLTLVAMVVATARATIVWPWTVGGIVLTGVATIVFFVLMGR